MGSPSPDSPRRAPGHRGRSAVRVIVATCAALIVLLLGADPARAHTAFESSNPADGAVVGGTVDSVTITFTGPASPAGDGFTALDGDGRLRVPASVDVADGRIFELQFEPGLTGEVGIRWSVKAQDAHPIAGAFSFTAEAPAAAASTTLGTVPAMNPADAPATAPGTTDRPAATTTTLEPVPLAAAGAPTTTATDDESRAITLEEFLAAADDVPGDGLATIGRVVELFGVVLGVGVLAFLAVVLVGNAQEVGRTALAVRVLGVVIAAGATVELVGLARFADESIRAQLTTSAGVATLLRIAGGLALAGGLATGVVANRRGPGATVDARALSAAVMDIASTSPAGRARVPEENVRWRADGASWLAYAGVVAVVISFWFDGHTASRGFRPLHALTNSVHLVAASVWAGGIAAMTVVLWSRFRQGRRTRSLELLVRFSPLATLSLAAVAVAGLAMAVFVLDSPGDLISTEWGQLLLLKTGAVALAAAGGAYNHFRLVPALNAAPDDQETLSRVRATVTAEAILLAFVVVVTARLVSAAT